MVEYNLSEKIYNALFYSFLKYKHQLHMLSHVKYRISIFKWLEKKPKYYLVTPMLKTKLLWIYSVRKKIYNALFYSVLEYKHQLHMLSHVKYRISIFKWIEKKPKYYLVTPMLKTKLLWIYSVRKKIHNALFFSVLEYIHQLHMVFHVK